MQSNYISAAEEQFSFAALFQWNEFTARDAVTPAFLPPIVAVIWRITACGLAIWFAADAADHYSGTIIDIKSSIAFASMIMTVIYFAIGVVVHFIHLAAVKRVRSGDGGSEPVPYGFRFHWVLFEMLFVIALILTGIHWLVYDKLGVLGELTFQSVSLYALNTVLLAVDFLFVTRYVPLISHTFFVAFGVGVILLSIYIVQEKYNTLILDFFTISTLEPARSLDILFVGVGIHTILCAVGIIKSKLLSLFCSGTRVGAGNIPGPACAQRSGASLLADNGRVNMEPYGSAHV